MVFFPTISFTFLLAQVLLCNAAISDSLPAAIIGTYNVTFAIVSVPSELAYSLVPAKYREARAILPPDPTQFPALEADELPIFLEVGREADAGPPLLNFESFQEAKIEVPNVKPFDNSSSPFLYKRFIAVDAFIDKIGSLIQFGLNTSVETFIPANSSNASNYDYALSNVLNATFQEVSKEEAGYPLSTYQSIGSQPWFAEFLTCAQHSYNFTSLSETKYLTGSVTLYPPYSGPELLHLLRSVPMLCEVYILSRSLALCHAPYSCKRVDTLYTLFFKWTTFFT